MTGGLLEVETQGRRRYYRLAGAHIALALETLAAIGVRQPIRQKPLSREAAHLRLARCRYDNLAGEVGVAVAKSLEARSNLAPGAEKQFTVTPTGKAWFGRMELDIGSLKPGRNGLARQCLDWTERQHHLAGPLGVQLVTLMCTDGWVRRAKASRAVTVAPAGWTRLKAELGVNYP